MPPTGSGVIKAKDLIPLITALGALPDELGMSQASPVLIAFYSMAKKQPDGTLLWNLDGTTFGKFLINDVDFMSLMALGGMDAPTPSVDPDAPDEGSAVDGKTDGEAKDPATAE